MGFYDLFRPYSAKNNEDLKKYLKEHDGHSTNNLFHGSKYFFVMRDMRLMIPNSTYIRVDQSPAPDIGYFVNSNFLLESSGEGVQNMSLVGARKRVYNPAKALKGKNWSVSHLNL
jgi:hypothetical protein